MLDEIKMMYYTCLGARINILGNFRASRTMQKYFCYWLDAREESYVSGGDIKEILIETLVDKICKTKEDKSNGVG